MITDPPPRAARKRADFSRSEAIPKLPLPPPEAVRAATQTLFAAMASGEKTAVSQAATQVTGELSRFYGVPEPKVKVLGVRPHVVTDGVCTYQLFGDYTPAFQRIRVWMRTAIRGQVSSPKALLNTLLHELCHHLDATHLDCPDSPHTRGFFTRVDQLYHFTLATPEHARRPLHWVKRGTRWQIDWQRSRARPAAPASNAQTDDKPSDLLAQLTRGQIRGTRD